MFNPAVIDIIRIKWRKDLKLRIGILDTPETASRGAAIVASGGVMAPAAVVEYVEAK